MKFIKLFILFVLVSSFAAFAQKDAAAKAILGPLSQKYRSYKAIKTDFTFTLDNPAQNMKASQNGTLTVEPKTNKYHIALFAQGSNKDIEQEIISDGKSQWSYNRGEKEVQLTNAEHNSTSFNPAQLFTMYEHGYKYLYTGEVKQGGKIYQQVDLSPEDDKSNFFKIRLSIDKAKKIIYSVLVFDKNGSRYNYLLKDFMPNPPVTADTFSWDAKTHAGIEVVDLR